MRELNGGPGGPEVNGGSWQVLPPDVRDDRGASPAVVHPPEIRSTEGSTTPLATPVLGTTTQVATELPEVVRYTKTRISVTGGPCVGRSLEATSGIVRIGWADDNDLVLPDPTVSRHHCELDLTDAGIRLRDLGSRNGVMIKGLKVADAVIGGACALQLGDTVLTIAPLPETLDVILATKHRFGDVLGASRRARELFAHLERFAATDMTLLIEGETGTGKDLVAESVHGASGRRDGPFVVFDCSAVPPSLIESELFGHERGAFTGAVNARVGLFEEASGGTLFLDEIGELPRDLQPKLLRVIEKREVKRVGSNRPLSVDVRLIAATNRNLRGEVNRGTFREDLFYRLAAAYVVVPPLRERMEDLEILVDHFLTLEGSLIALADIPAHAWEMLRAHRWPGNVRELRNAVQRLMIMSPLSLDLATPPSGAGATAGGGALASSIGPPLALAADPSVPGAGSEATEGAVAGQPGGSAEMSGAGPGDGAAIEPLRLARARSNDDFERAFLHRILTRTKGNVTRAAAIAEVSRQMIQKLMRKHGVFATNRPAGGPPR